MTPTNPAVTGPAFTREDIALLNTYIARERLDAADREEAARDYARMRHSGMQNVELGSAADHRKTESALMSLRDRISALLPPSPTEEGNMRDQRDADDPTI